MRAAAVLLVALVMAGCATEPVAIASPTPSSAPSVAVFQSPLASPTPAATSTPTSPSGPASWGVLVNLDIYPPQYVINFVGRDGSAVSGPVAKQRTPISTPAGHGAALPYVSASRRWLYYLDGDSSVWRTTPATTERFQFLSLSSGPMQEAAFAVSPDDSRIAWSVLDYSRLPVHVSLYVATVDALSSIKPIFESDSDYVWPVAWHGGLLVLAHAAGPYRESDPSGPGVSNPYGAITYHLVDPATADRKVLMGGCTASGPLSPVGTACIQGGTIGWDGGIGQVWGTSNWGTVSSAAALNTDGTLVAAQVPGQSSLLGIYGPDGSLRTSVGGPSTRYWAGWLDAGTLIVPLPNDSSSVVILGSGSPVLLPVGVGGYYATLFPTDLV